MAKRDEPSLNNLGLILKKARIRLGYTRDQIAERAGISNRHLAAIENEGKNPSVDVLFRLIRALGISADTVVYPNSNHIDSGEDQLFRLIGTCDDRNRRAIKAVVNALVDTGEAAE